MITTAVVAAAATAPMYREETISEVQILSDWLPYKHPAFPMYRYIANCTLLVPAVH
jgi:hypothetical protein